MNPFQIVATLRKFGNYLAGLFPVLVTLVDWFKSQLRILVEHPLVKPWRKRAGESRIVAAIWKVVERFYWRDYAKDRLDLNVSPPATLPVLRPIFQICALLCILIPLTQYPFCPVKIETFSGFEGSAPAWSVMLWLLAFPCAWASLLVGCAVSNRVVFIVAALSALYIASSSVITLERSYWNALLGLSVLSALAFCERSLKSSENLNRLAGVLTALLVGAAAGCQIIILTPVKPMLAQWLASKDPLVGIGAGVITGIVCGLIAFAWARLPVREERPHFLRGAPIAIGKAVWFLAFLIFIVVVAGAIRGGLEQSGSVMVSSLYLFSTYMWPIWYFIGIGLLHKLLGSSKVVAKSAEMAIPEKILSPAMVLLLFVALTICLSEPVCLWLSLQTGAFAIDTLNVVYPIYKACQPLIWSNPMNAMSTHWLTWVLVFDFAVIIMLAMRRKLTADAIVRLFFMTCLAAFLIWEYVFQLTSFTRTPTHSIIMLFLFSIWLLWLMHTVGWRLSCSSSRLWPAIGRLAIYGGIVTLAILEIHARSACKDFKLMNELYLTMFRGIIDVGLPYYFYVWASKRLSRIPATVGTMLGVFSLGALLSFLFNVLEKYSAAGFTQSGLMELVNTQLEGMRTTGSANLDVSVPDSWYLIRALAYVFALSLIYLFVRLSKRKATASGASTLLFALLAFAGGIASFSRTLVDLPIPGEWRALIAPIWQETMFNCNIVQTYLAFWIPALILAISQFQPRFRTVWFAVAALLAVVANYGISMIYGVHEPFLRATEMIYPAIVMVSGVFVILVALAVRLMERQIGLAETEADRSESGPVQDGGEELALLADAPSEKSNKDKKRPAELFSLPSLVALVLVGEFVLAIVLFKQNDLRFETRTVSAFQHPVVIASNWQTLQMPGPANKKTGEQADPKFAGSTILRRKLTGSGFAIWQMGIVPSHPKGTTELLKKLLGDAVESRAFPNLAVEQIKPWSKYYPGALACFFKYDMVVGKDSTPFYGLSVLVPRSGSETEYYTLYTSPTEIEIQQWELVIAVDNLKR